MKKCYVVMYDPEYGGILSVFNSLSDAEEFLLSMAEEEAYAMLIDHVFYYENDMESYINMLNNCPIRKYFKTLDGMILYDASNYYLIHECTYLD